MSANINLVNQKNPNKDHAQRVHKLKAIAYCVLIFSALIVIIIFSLEYRFSASYVKKQQAQLLSEMDQYSARSAKFFIVNSSLTEIGTILGARKNYHEKTKEIYSVKPSDILISEYLHDDSGIKFAASTNSLVSLDSFLNALIDLSQKEVIGGLAMEKLVYDGNNYSVEILTQ